MPFETNARAALVFAAGSLGFIPAGRRGGPQEHVPAVARSASAPASCVTGSIVRTGDGLIRSI